MRAHLDDRAFVENHDQVANSAFGQRLWQRTSPGRHRALTALLLLGTQTGQATFIGLGMWLAIIMWFNVWFVIWPNQKKALGIVTVEADAKAKAARTAMLFSRTNTMLSVPMLLCMAAQSHLG